MSQPRQSTLQAAFVARVYPVVLRFARKAFRRDDDAVAEAVALAWKWTRRLHEQGKPLYTSKLAQYAVRAVRSGRRVAGQLKAKDALNPLTWQRKGFTVCKLPDFSTESANPLSIALADHKNAAVDDHVAFKIDWPAFLAMQSERHQKLADLFAVGNCNRDVAALMGVSQGRACQMRKELRDRWQDLQGE